MAELLLPPVDRPALIDEAGRQSRAQLNGRINRLVHALRGLGLRAGDHIAVLSGNRRELYECLLAALHGGWVFVPVNAHATRDEVAYVLDDADIAAFVMDGLLDRVAGGQLEGLGPVARTFELGRDPTSPYERLLAAGDPDEPADQRCGTLMLYTSGTTGRPKGVRATTLPHGGPVGGLAAMAGSFCDQGSIPADGVTLLCGPAYHSAQLAFTMWPLLAGSTVVMSRKFVADEALRLMASHGVTNVHLVPTQFVRMLALPDEQRTAITPRALVVAFHGAAPCPPDLKRRMIEWWGPCLVEYYGSTETGLVSLATSEEWLQRPGTVGRPLPDVELQVVGDDGRRLGPGEMGQLFVRRAHAKLDYHNDSAKTASAHLEPGLFTVGDVGRVDEEGYIYLTDRRIDVIISGGVNIYPAEIEGVLATHPAVADVAVFGVPNDEFGEEVKAVVQIAGAGHDEARLRGGLEGWCRARLAGFKTPRSFEFVASLPRTDSGKLDKRGLRNPYWESQRGRI